MKHINTQLLKRVALEYNKTDKEKRKCNAQADKALHLAKRAIFAIHRGDISGADKELTQITQLLKKLGAQKNTKGPIAAALEEYVEACITLAVAQKKTIASIPGISIPADTYIAALSDAIGEMVRLATRAATNKDAQEVIRLHGIAQEATAFLYTLDLTGYVRQKFDQAKGHMRKMEHIVYELSIRI